MTGQQKHLGDVQSVKLAISGLDGLAILPAVAAEVFSLMSDTGFSPVVMADWVKMSPGLTVRILSLAHNLGVRVEDHHFSLSQILERLPVAEVRNILLETELWDTAGEEGVACGGLTRLACIEHSLAVAHTSGLIAQAMVVGTDVNLAYMVGLVHDIGKLALHELMPEGFTAIVNQAEMAGVGSCELERAYLGLDHATLGKYLARKWGFPSLLETGIWLHHSPIPGLGMRQSEADVAKIVFCADCLVRSTGLGFSGSFDQGPDLSELADLVHVDATVLQGIADQIGSLPQLEDCLSRLRTPVSMGLVARTMQRLALQLGQTQSHQAQENARLRSNMQELDFVHDICSLVDARLDPAEYCMQWAKQWQRFFQTSKVCLFLIPDANDQFVETVIVSGLMECHRALLDKPIDNPMFLNALRTQQGVHAVEDGFDWLFSQLEVDFDPEKTKFMPLWFRHDPLGGLIFELNYPADTREHESLFIDLASVGSTLLHAVLARRHHEWLCDEIIGLGLNARSQDARERDRLIMTSAEMAAGFAHELNNPLSVVAGRAQLLMEDETDPEKQRVLRQIEENAHEISVILNELISYAEPSQPRPNHSAVGQILDEAVQLAQHKSGRDDWSVSIHLDRDADEVFVDSAQIASALANLLVNSVEAYRGDIGTIEIDGKKIQARVELQVRDRGCGMDRDTLHKAVTPFFSVKPAGRQRGMGIAYAARLVELNRGHLSITSRINQGTVVTIWLPTRPSGE